MDDESYLVLQEMNTAQTEVIILTTKRFVLLMSNVKAG